MEFTPLPIHQVLVPLDGSRLAEATLPIALALAERLGAEITLLHVLERDAPTTVHGEPHLMTAKDAEAYLARIGAELAARGVSVDWHVHDNPEKSVTESLAEHVEELNADLIVLASHGSGGLRGFLYGGVAQQVLRQGRSPLLMTHVKDPNTAAKTFPCEAIAIPLNGDRDGEAALPAALTLAKGFGAALQLIRAVPTAGTLGADQSATAVLVPGATRAILDLEAAEAQRYLDELAEKLTGAGVPVRRSIVRGDPAQAVSAETERVNAGLLAMATHAKAGLSGIWAGSVGTKIIDRAKIPLLLVRLP